MEPTLLPHKPNAWRRLMALQLVAGLALVAAMLLGGYATYRLGGSRGLFGMTLAAGITWVASAAAMIPACLWIEKEPKQLALAMLAGGAIRFLFVLIGAVPIAIVDKALCTPFLIWIGIAYLAVLAADTGVVLHWIHGQNGQGEKANDV